MSFLLQVHSNERMPLVQLWRLIFKYIFDEKNCGQTTRKTIETEVLKWNNLVKYQKRVLTEKYGPGFDGYAPIGKKGSVIDEIEYQIGMMSSWLVKNENGEWDQKKANYAIHKIDYRTVAPMDRVFPEIKKNYARGRAALEQAMKDHPEDYQ